MSKGATVWSRDTIESEIFFYKPDKWFKIWFYVVNRVNFKDSKLFKRGEGLISYSDIMEHTGASREQVRKCLKWMNEEHMLEHRRTTRGMIRIVKNFDKYQNLKNYKNTDGNIRGTLADPADRINKKIREEGDPPTFPLNSYVQKYMKNNRLVFTNKKYENAEELIEDWNNVKGLRIKKIKDKEVSLRNWIKGSIGYGQVRKIPTKKEQEDAFEAEIQAVLRKSS
jgi:hypothetical protein